MAVNRRPDRVAEGIREEIALFLQVEGLGDPRVTALVTVTAVEVTRDLRTAKVFVSVMGSDEEKELTAAALAALAPRLRGHVGRQLRLRSAPELYFRMDESISHAARIETLLRQIKDEERPASAPAADLPAPDDDPPG